MDGYVEIEKVALFLAKYRFMPIGESEYGTLLNHINAWKDILSDLDKAEEMIFKPELFKLELI